MNGCLLSWLPKPAQRRKGKPLSKRGARSAKRRDSRRRKQHDRADRSRRAQHAFAQGLEAHRRGDLASAKRIYREIVTVEPKHAAAWHLLGFAEFQSHRFAEAISHIREALRREPTNGEFYHNLALAQLAARQFEDAATSCADAVRCGYRDANSYLQVGLERLGEDDFVSAEHGFRLAIVVDPNSADARNCLGLLLRKQGHHDSAVENYRQAIALDANHVEAITNLGNACRDAGNYDDATASYRRALVLNPTFAAAHNNLGVTYERLGQLDEALAAYKTATDCDHSFAEAFSNLGNTYRQLGRYEEAAFFLLEALRTSPNHAEVHNNLGVVRRAQRLFDEAIREFETAARLDAQSWRIWSNLGATLADQERLGEADACYAELERLDPQQALWKLPRASLCPTVFSSRDEMDRYWQQLAEAIQTVADRPWNVEAAELWSTAPQAPFNLQFFSQNIKQMKVAFAKVFEELASRTGLEILEPRASSDRAQTGVARVGFFVSAGHETVFLNSMRGVIERLSRDRFQAVILCSAAGQQRLSSELQRERTEFISVPDRFDKAAETIVAAELDLLYYFEIGTDVANYFLPLLRLAPVQCTSWGIQVTSGIPNVDCYLSSELVEPANAQEHYSERLVLADTLLCYRERAQLDSLCRTRGSFGFSDGDRLYVCAQQLGKFHPDFDGWLGEILRQDPRGILVVTADPQTIPARHLRSRLDATIPEQSERVRFVGRLARPEYLCLLANADVLLDPPHFAGVNSTYDGLSLHQPIVTLPSPFHRGRYTLGCYRKMGFEDCVVDSGDAYVALAVQIANERDFREHLVTKIADTSNALFEDITAVTEHERLFEALLSRRGD